MVVLRNQTIHIIIVLVTAPPQWLACPIAVSSLAVQADTVTSKATLTDGEAMGFPILRHRVVHDLIDLIDAWSLDTFPRGHAMQLIRNVIYDLLPIPSIPFPTLKVTRVAAPQFPLPYIQPPPFPDLLAHSSTTTYSNPNVSSAVKLDSFTFSELEPQTRQSPIIVGDHYELAETVALQYIGKDQGFLLAKAECQAALLPMSGYEKPQDTIVGEYNAGRPSQAYSSLTEHNALRPSRDPLYLQYALPGAADPQLQQSSTAYDRQSDHMDYGASPIYQPRATLEATLSAYNNFETRKTSCNPERGTKGTVIYIYLDSTRDLLSPTPPNATLMFATHPVPASLTRFPAREQDVCYKYVVSATAPAFSETGSSNLKIPLNLQLQEPSRLDLDLIDIGPWQYEDDEQLEHRSSPQELSRKRKTTDAPSDTLRSTKRAAPSEQKNAHCQDYGSYPYLSASSANPPSLQSELNTMERRYTAYGRSQLQQSLQSEPNTMGSQGLIGGVSNSQPPMRPPMGQTSPWNSSYGSRYLSGRNPQPNAAQSFQISSISSPSPANPQLIRTSSLAPQSSRGATSAGSSSDGSFNPYTLYPNQAVLEVCGNLDAMQEQANWTPEERATKRRIIRFWREQNWATVKAYFKPVRVDEQPLPHERNECRINCIYWEDRKRCYITSVDTISLLESLVTTKFGVDEKNRIRRNLQGYRPCTISKGKPESEDFFRLIMGLSDPKPRIIEKDVKVFEWSILEQALNKVISKYSADPSSIARPLRKQPSSNFSGTPSEAGASRYSALSSRSTSGSAASGAYAPTLESSTLSPPSTSHGLSSYSQASPSQQFLTPSLSHSYTVPTLGSQYIPYDTFNSPYANPVSIPSHSPAYTASTIDHRRSSDAPTDGLSPSTSLYSSGPRTSAFFANPYAPQEQSNAKATLGLPGRASTDLSAGIFFNTDVASSDRIGHAQYRRQSGVSDEPEVKHFKEE